MKIPMRAVLAMFAIAIFFCSMFLYSSSSGHANSPYFEYREEDFGRVLGIEEAVKDFYGEVNAGPSSKPLVQAETRRRPILNSGAPEFSTDFNVLAMDSASGNVLFANKARENVSIASITKLATALVLLDQGIDWEQVLTIVSEDRVEGGQIYVYAGDQATLKDLFNLSLIGSANSATQALVRATGLGNGEFVALMNEKMDALGLYNTRFVDPIGLSNSNVSTAMEVAQLVRAAFGRQEIMEIASKESYQFMTRAGKTRRVKSTNLLFGAYPENDISLIGGKTGYTALAGYCFTGVFSIDEGNQVVSVVLGGDTYSSRFNETRRLLDWVADSYNWK